MLRVTAHKMALLLAKKLKTKQNQIKQSSAPPLVKQSFVILTLLV